MSCEALTALRVTKGPAGFASLVLGCAQHGTGRKARAPCEEQRAGRRAGGAGCLARSRPESFARASRFRAVFGEQRRARASYSMDA
jgi:hypothetical protein